MPQSFDLSEVLSMVQDRQHLFNIRRRSMSGSLFVLDMAKYAKFLTGIAHTTTKPTQTFRDFINLTLVKAPRWTDCVSECEDPTTDMLVSHSSTPPQKPTTQDTKTS